MRIKWWVVVGALALGNSGFAGDKGNGGVSVVCRDSTGVIASAELLDIYEGKELYRQTYSAESLGVETRIKLLQAELSQYPNFLKRFQETLTRINANTTFVSRGNELMPTNDALPILRKKGCEYEQAATYTNDGQLFISQEIYDAFDPLNKAALFVHEAFYWIYRQGKNPQSPLNSRDSRKLTAYALAANPQQAVVRDLVRKHLTYEPGESVRLETIAPGTKVVVKKDIYVEADYGWALFKEGRNVTTERYPYDSQLDVICNVTLRGRLEGSHTRPTVIKAGREYSITKIEVLPLVIGGQKIISLHLDSSEVESVGCQSVSAPGYTGPWSPREPYEASRREDFINQINHLSVKLGEARTQFGDFLEFLLEPPREVQ